MSVSRTEKTHHQVQRQHYMRMFDLAPESSAPLRELECLGQNACIPWFMILGVVGLAMACAMNSCKRVLQARLGRHWGLVHAIALEDTQHKVETHGSSPYSALQASAYKCHHLHPPQPPQKKS
eukprot:5522175-Amphidinium_carterae.1